MKQATLKPDLRLWPFNGKQSDHRGFKRYDSMLDDCRVTIVEPRRAAKGYPWIWRAAFFDHRPEVDVALLKRGFFLVFIDTGNSFGCPDAIARWKILYRQLAEVHGLSKKPALEGLSRGGLYVYNWAAAHPDAVSCIYADNPVCDFKSWPGGKGKGPGNPDCWRELVKCYRFRSEKEALDYKKNPVDNLEPLARAGIPLLHVCGDADETVPYDENTAALKREYERLGGRIELIVKKGGKHHPHGLPDPAPIINFVLAHTGFRWRHP